MSQIRSGRHRGYAETREVEGLVATPQNVEDCLSILREAKSRNFSIAMRGAGYSYTDSITNENELLIDFTQMNRVLHFDADRGEIVCEPGVTLGVILEKALPHHLILHSIPGGAGVSVGGAIGHDIHGKDCTRFGNFSERVIRMKILLANETTIEIERGDPLFDAFNGGMGLLGILLEATLKLDLVPSAYVESETLPASNLKENMEILEDFAKRHDYSVSWVDHFARDNEVGRGFVVGASFIREKTLAPSPEDLRASLRISRFVFRIFPARITWYLLRPFFGRTLIRIYNAFQYHLNRLKGRQVRREFFTDYNFMHNKIPRLKEVFRPHGFIEMQCLVPRRTEVLRGLLEICQKHGCESLLLGIKIHRSSTALLGFGADGYSPGIHFGLRGKNSESVKRFAAEFIAYTESHGGQIYVAKDEFLSRESFKKMYPRYAEFLKIKKKLDPTEVFQSDVYRRLVRVPELGVSRERPPERRKEISL